MEDQEKQQVREMLRRLRAYLNAPPGSSEDRLEELIVEIEKIVDLVNNP